MTTTYLPVITLGAKRRYQPWDKDCLVHCNSILVSPFVTGWHAKRIDFCNDLIIYADSGGFRALTHHEKISALKVLRWQERIANKAFTLDEPPHRFPDYTQKQFQQCMKKSNQNADLMYKLKVNDDMELWGVIQGKNFDECKAWYIDLIKDHQYDGYCLVLSVHKSMTDLPWIEQLEFAKTINKRIHFLGSNNRLLVLVLARLSRLTGIDYTYDSSTFSIGGRYGKYIHPKTWQHVSFSKDERDRDKIESLPCNCPICSNHSPRDLFHRTELINLHNLYVITQFNETVNKLSDEQFFSLLKNLVKNDLHMKQIIQLLGFSNKINNWENYYDYMEVTRD